MNILTHRLYWANPVEGTAYPIHAVYDSKTIEWSVLVEARSEREAIIKAKEFYGVSGLANSRVNTRVSKP